MVIKYRIHTQVSRKRNSEQILPACQILTARHAVQRITLTWSNMVKNRSLSFFIPITASSNNIECRQAKGNEWNGSACHDFLKLRQCASSKDLQDHLDFQVFLRKTFLKELKSLSLSQIACVEQNAEPNNLFFSSASIEISSRRLHLC